jgi:hypothetical protein
MDLNEIHEHWDRDSKIDQTELGQASLLIPQLHSKYMKFFSQERLLLKKLEMDHKELHRLKWEYYTGSLDHETMQEKGWSPNPLKIIRSDVGMYLDSDSDIIKSNLKMAYVKEKIDLLESIIKTLNGRGFLIKNFIDWHKFTNGM